jgi:hypothetical protein
MTTLAHVGSDHSPLRRIIQLDAVAVFVSSTAALVGAAPIEAATGIPATLLQLLGVVFLAYGGLLAFVTTQPSISRSTGWTLMSVNFAWVALSIAALAFGWLPLTPVGFWVVVAQALLVDLIGVAQLVVLWRSR